ncbi:RAB6-interacting golgin-like [Anneissia japonica]|uniref:RAB6-interacting golgin-like n=1 Tax=Anneissia japonica TaxID=1529436 RepID=UPI0014255DE8|nr:RAB6-interacting golgin-like [Anneissia japonica]XP_033109092.1 RAB6-interacting golgin-like [Anneissia japonica]XP_033109094.1 RAB6-interacting golgin-like [Anneissia japonica]XP_033109095.1 RAB6-interacting golgin-like [Anneissia japonica]XP_033109096.1 RAB6-interacting golgin-like [Anneissia japonica]XP_033109097.1 RAB6-interacting golgin-like [Anneissia japonica]
MEGWSGFTDEQLKQFRGQDDGKQNKPPQRKKERKNHPTTNRNRAREKLHHQKQHGHDAEDIPININQMLSTPSVLKSKPTQPTEGQRKTALPASDDSGQTVINNGVKQTQLEKNHEDGNQSSKDEGKDEVKSRVEESAVQVNELDEAQGRRRELTQLEMIQKKQMEMEEENRKKKMALTKAINERKKKTQAETKQLAFIQKELGKLESLLSKDVRILRDKIEESSFEYNAARRRYEKAESEFVNAKMYLHKVTEQKEALTEHLYTIIQENETRKANKLAELTEKLNMENIDEYIAAAEKEMNSERSPSHSTALSPKVESTTESSENRLNTSQNTVNSTSDQHLDADAGNSSVAVTASRCDTPNQRGLETITEVDSEVTDISVIEEANENKLSIVSETNTSNNTVNMENDTISKDPETDV